MATVNSTLTYSGVDHVYLNIEILNETNIPQPAVFSQDYTSPIVSNPSDYHLSVVRFTAPAINIPIFTWDRTIQVYNPPLSEYVAGNGNTYTITLRNTTNNSTVQVPLIYVVGGDNTLGQYTVYSYQFMIDALNTAILNAFNGNVGLGIPAVDKTGTGATNPPVVTFDSLTELSTISFPTAGWTTNVTTTNPSGTARLQLFMNDNLYHFFESFHSINHGFAQLSGEDNEIISENTGDNSLIVNAPGANANGIYYSTALFPAVTYFAMKQEFNSLSLWNDLTNIIFASNGMPVRNEYLPSSAGLQDSSLPILTDFQPLISNGTDARSILQYFPSSEYRLIDLTSTQPLVHIGLNVLWGSKVNVLNPLVLSPNDSVTMKLMFRRKGSANQCIKELQRDGGKNYPDIPTKVELTNKQGGKMSAGLIY